MEKTLLIKLVDEEFEVEDDIIMLANNLENYGFAMVENKDSREKIIFTARNLVGIWEND